MKKAQFLALVSIIFLVSCMPMSKNVTSPTETVVLFTSTITPILPTSTPTPVASTATITSTSTPTSTATPPPYDYQNILFPLSVEDVVILKKNFNSPINYGDGTHDGNDIVIIGGKEVPVLAVDDGYIEFFNFIKENNIGYEIHLGLGVDREKSMIHAVYVHMTKAQRKLGDFVKRGEVIGYVIKPKNDHLHFEIRVDKNGRYEKNNIKRGEEVNITNILTQYLPKNKGGVH